MSYETCHECSSKIVVCDRCFKELHACPPAWIDEQMHKWYVYGTFDPTGRHGGSTRYHACRNCGVPQAYINAEARERGITVEEVERQIKGPRHG